MSDWILAAVRHDTDAWTGALTEYGHLIGLLTINSTEANEQFKVRDSYVVHDLWFRVTANTLSAAATLRTRKNGANGNLSVSVGSGVTGIFTDTTNKDNLVSGDLYCFQYVTPGGTTGVLTSTAVSVIMTGNGTAPWHAMDAAAGRSFSSDTFMGPIGRMDGTSESDVRVIVRTQTVFTGMSVHISSNSRSDTTTIKSRDNGADGNQTVSIGAGLTGRFEDVGGGIDTLTAGQTYNSRIQFAGGSGSITVSAIDQKGTGALRLTSQGPPTLTDTRYLGLFSQADLGPTTTEANAQVTARAISKLKNIYVYVSSNTRNGAGTFALRRNGASAISVSIPTSTTGVFEETTTEITTAAADLLNFMLQAGGTTGSMLSWVHSVEQLPGPVINSVTPSTFPNGQAGIDIAGSGFGTTPSSNRTWGPTAVNASADDAQQAGSTVTINGTTIGGSLDATTEWVGIRFPLVGVPKGATIVSAFLEVVPSATSEDEPLVTIFGEDADNAAAFTTTNNDISNRTRTSASVAWSDTNLGASGSSYHSTPDIKTLIQPIIDRSGWAANNALAIIIQGGATTTRDLTIEAYDLGPGTNPPRLTITYTVPAYLYLGSSDRYPPATRVQQTVNSWADTAIDFDAVGTGLGGNIFLYAVTTDGLVSAPYPVSLVVAATAVLASSAALAATGKLTAGGAAALAASANVTPTAKLTAAGAAALAASASLAATSQLALLASANLQASASLAADARATYAAAAALAATAALTPTAALTANAAAALAASGALSAQGGLILPGSAALASSASLAAVGRLNLPGAAALASSATLAAQAALTLAAQAALAAAAAISPIAKATYAGDAALAASGALTATAKATYAAAAALSATAALAGTPMLILPGAAALNGSATLAALAAITASAEALLTSTSALAAASSVSRPGSAALGASAILTAAAAVTFSAAATLPAAAALSATAETSSSAEAILAASASLAAAASLSLPGEAVLASAASLVASAYLSLAGQAALTASGALTGSALLTHGGAAALAATATLSATANVQTGDVSAILAASASLSAAGMLTLAAAAALSAGATLSAAPLLTLGGATVISTASMVAAQATAIYGGSAQLTGQASLTATATATGGSAEATLTATATLVATATMLEEEAAIYGHGAYRPNVDIDGLYDPAVDGAGRYSVNVTAQGVYDPVVSGAGSYEAS